MNNKTVATIRTRLYEWAALEWVNRQEHELLQEAGDYIGYLEDKLASSDSMVAESIIKLIKTKRF